MTSGRNNANRRRKFWATCSACLVAATLILFTGIGAPAQEMDNILNPILEVVMLDTDRLIRRVLRDGWNTDVRYSLATNYAVAGLSIDDRIFRESLEQHIALAGGDDAFAAQAVTGNHVNGWLVSNGYGGVLAPAISMDEARETLEYLRESGFSSIPLAVAESVRPNPQAALAVVRGDGGDETCNRSRCDAALRRAANAWKVATVVCAAGPSKACAAAILFAIGMDQAANYWCRGCTK